MGPLGGAGRSPRPGPRLTVAWQDRSKSGPKSQDSFEAGIDLGAWEGGGQPGSGDGLRVFAADEDLEFDDPIGYVYVPVERFEPAHRRRMHIETEDWNGLAVVELVYSAH